MKLQKREKMLLGVVGGAIAFVGLVAFVMTGDSTSDEQLLKDKELKAADLERKQKEQKRAADEKRQLADWQKRSLPPDPSLAQSLYRSWLSVMCDRSGLLNPVVHSEKATPYRIGGEEIYTKFKFSVQAHASLEQIVNFLHAFYSAGHLHQIDHLKIVPVLNDPKLFDVHVSIEALSSPKSPNKDRLDSEPGRELKLPQLAAYRDLILKRNFFAVYVPPTAPRATQTPTNIVQERSRVETPPSPKVDFAKFAVVSAFTQDEEDGSWQVWLRDRTKGKTWQLKEGEEFKVGSGTGQIRTILAPEGEVILRFDGKLRKLHLDESLRDGKVIDESLRAGKENKE
jgi:hypothetical protein